ncbi:MAG: hypothetical protein VYC34_00800, partial [Planctomycetota bacterium]|nr:hypothetical protein [Planctomycetota bacterium]
YQSAISTYRRVAQSASGADARAAARLGMGRMHQALGDALSGQLLAIEMLAGVLEQAAEASPPMPQSDAYAAEADRLWNVASDARDAMRAAYAEAKSNFETAGARGEEGDRIQQIVQEMDARFPAEGEPASEQAPQ